MPAGALLRPRPAAPHPLTRNFARTPPASNGECCLFSHKGMMFCRLHAHSRRPVDCSAPARAVIHLLKPPGRIYRACPRKGSGRVAEWFKAPVLKTGRGFTLPREFESHPFRHFAGLLRLAEHSGRYYVGHFERFRNHAVHKQRRAKGAIASGLRPVPRANSEPNLIPILLHPATHAVMETPGVPK